jgi:hypothetical protein
MSLINEVKKVLRNTGVEMDADDIATDLARSPRYKGRLDRKQVAHALSALCASDADIIRTRTGLYQHVHLEQVLPNPLAAPRRRSLTIAAPALSSPDGPSSPRPAPTGDRLAIVVEGAYVRDRLGARVGESARIVDFGSVSAYLVGLAELRLNRPAQIAWCDTSTGAVAELTRRQYDRADVIAIAHRATLDEACLTADRLNRPIRVWTIGAVTADNSHRAGGTVAETYPLSTDDLLARCVQPAPQPTPLILDRPASQRVHLVNARTQPAPVPPAGNLDSLWHLDVTLFRRPIDGVTGHGGSDALRHQALLVGRTYAERWWSVVNAAARTIVTASDDTFAVPGRLYGDLLTFAETHGIRLYGSQTLKDLLRRGFWTYVSDVCPDRQRPQAPTG